MGSLSAITSLNSLMSQRLLGEHSRAIAQITERLATGKRINRASDDPSGMMVATSLEGRVQSIEGDMTSTGALMDKLAVMEGYYGVWADLGLELEGVVMAAGAGDGVGEAEREAYQVQADGIIEAMDYLYKTATYKGEALFTGGIGISRGQTYEHIALTKLDDLGASFVPQRGAGGLAASMDPTDSADEPSTDPAPPNPRELEPPDSPWATIRDLMTGGRLNLVDGDLEGAMQVAKQTRQTLIKEWGMIGTQMKSAESRLRTLAAELEGNMGAYGEIMDTDYARETTALIREQVLQQASIFVLKKTQDMQKQALALLMG